MPAAPFLLTYSQTTKRLSRARWIVVAVAGAHKGRGKRDKKYFLVESVKGSPKSAKTRQWQTRCPPCFSLFLKREKKDPCRDDVKARLHFLLLDLLVCQTKYEKEKRGG
jgi:hypothetical protein